MVTSWNLEIPYFLREKLFSLKLVKDWKSPLEKLRNLNPWRYSNISWTRPWATCYNFCFEQKAEVWTRWPLEIPSNLCFYDLTVEKLGKAQRYPILFRQLLPVLLTSEHHISQRYLHLLTIHNRKVIFKILKIPYLWRSGAHQMSLENIGPKSVVRKHSALWWKMCQMDIIKKRWRAGRHKSGCRSATGN